MCRRMYSYKIYKYKVPDNIFVMRYKLSNKKKNTFYVISN